MEVWFLKRPLILIDCLKGMSLSQLANSSKQAMHNIVMTTVQFSLDNIADISGNQLRLNFSVLIV